MSLFAPQTEQKKDVLIEFKAGQMFKENNSKWVYPDKRKGLVILKQSPEDGLLHFVWKDRTTGVVERDLIVFPGDVVFKRVKECTTGRVYVLEFHSSKQKFFFWMQEAKDDKDNEICEKVNQYINNPPPPQPGGSEEMGSAFDPSILGNLSQAQLMELLTGGQRLESASSSQRRAATTSSTTSSGTTGSSSSSSSSSSAISSVITPETRSASSPPSSSSSSSSSSSTSSSSLSEQQRANILQAVLQQTLSQVAAKSASASARLDDVLNVDEIVASGVLNDAEVQRHLLSFLSEHDQQRATQPGHTPITVLIETLRSPQFAQAVRVFHQAIQSGEHGGPQGQMASLLRSFGLDPSKLPAESSTSATTANVSALEAFLRAIQQLQQAEKKSDAAPPPTAKK
jgi:26S proteasome regulatory subunit N13